MITLIAAIAIIVLLIYLARKLYNDGIVLLCTILCVLLIFATLTHCVYFFGKEIAFEMFVSNRNAVEQTYFDMKANGNQFENATITKQVSEINAQILITQRLSDHWFIGQYIDERVDSLKTISFKNYKP